MTERTASKTIRKGRLLRVASRGGPPAMPPILISDMSREPLPPKSLKAADLIAMARAARALRRDAGEA